MKNRAIVLTKLLVSALFLSVSLISFGQKLIYPDNLSSLTGGGTYCLNDPATDLTLVINTCDISKGQPTYHAITVTWYSNAVNSTTGGSQLSQTNSTTQTTEFTYIPPTSSSGTLYYYAIVTWTPSGDPACGNAGTLTSTTQEVIVNDVPGQPGAISGSTSVSPSTSGLTYSISAVPDATSYTWAVPSGWTIDAGQGTTSISVNSGTTGGDITVTADNSCGSSPAQTLTVTVLNNNCPESTSVSPSGVQTLCQGDAATLLTADVTTSGGSGTPTILYQWYYNASNSNIVAGATLLSG